MSNDKSEQPKVPFENGKRHLVKYRGENLYIFLGNKTLEMNMLDMNKGKTKDTDPHTLVGLGIISKLISLCMEFEVDNEVIAGEIWTESRKKDDLADIISRLLIKGE